MAGWEDILNKNEVLFKNSPDGEKQEARRRQEGEEEWDLSFNLFLSSPVMPPDKLFFREKVEGVGRGSIVRIHRNCLSRSKGSPECGGGSRHNSISKFKSTLFAFPLFLSLTEPQN